MSQIDWVLTRWPGVHRKSKVLRLSQGILCPLLKIDERILYIMLAKNPTTEMFLSLIYRSCRRKSSSKRVGRWTDSPQASGDNDLVIIKFENRLPLEHTGFLSQRPTQLALNSMRYGKAPSFFLNVFLLDHQNYCNRSFRNPVDILAEAPRGHALKLGNKLPLNSLSLSLGPYLCPRSMWASVVGPRAQIPGNTLTRIRVRWNQGLATNRP
jgi:hypothetical protein